MKIPALLAAALLLTSCGAMPAPACLPGDPTEGCDAPDGGGGGAGGGTGTGGGVGAGGGAGACTAANCGGCCDAQGVCVAGRGDAACGAQGAACISCGSGTFCQAGVCTPGGAGGSGGAGGGGPVGNSSPVINSVAINPAVLFDQKTITFSIVVSDVDGVNDLSSGKVTDVATGFLYETFAAPVGAGTLVQVTAILDWAKVQQAQSISFGPAGGSREVQVSFTDKAGHTAVQKLAVPLKCTAAGNSACGGVCRNLNDDPMNCGTCGKAVPSGALCVQGVADCGASYAACGTVCAYLKTDNNNCGACGNDCAAWATSHGISGSSAGCTTFTNPNGACMAEVRPTSATNTTCTAVCASYGLTCTATRWEVFGACGTAGMGANTTCSAVVNKGLVCSPGNTFFPLCNCR